MRDKAETAPTSEKDICSFFLITGDKSIVGESQFKIDMDTWITWLYKGIWTLMH